MVVMGDVQAGVALLKHRGSLSMTDQFRLHAARLLFGMAVNDRSIAQVL